MLGWVLAAGTAAFALVNIVFEVAGRFTHGPLAEYAAATTVMDWLVIGLKAIAAAVALLTVAKRQRFVSSSVLTALVWAVFALLTVYSLGNVLETIGMATGLTGSADQLTWRNIGYVLFFLLGAVGYGILAISYSRRVGSQKRHVVLGIVAGPLIIGLLLFAIPTLLASLGVMPG